MLLRALVLAVSVAALWAAGRPGRSPVNPFIEVVPAQPSCDSDAKLAARKSDCFMRSCYRKRRAE